MLLSGSNCRTAAAFLSPESSNYGAKNNQQRLRWLKAKNGAVLGLFSFDHESGASRWSVLPRRGIKTHEVKN